MPVKPDTFKPAADVWNFREQLHHIPYGIEWRKDNYLKRIKTSRKPAPASKNRKEAVAYLNQVYDSLKDAVNKNTLSDDQVKGFFTKGKRIKI